MLFLEKGKIIVREKSRVVIHNSELLVLPPDSQASVNSDKSIKAYHLIFQPVFIDQVRLRLLKDDVLIKSIDRIR